MVDTYSLFRERFRKLVLRFARENKVPISDVYYELYGAFLRERKSEWMYEDIKEYDSMLEYFDAVGLLPELLVFATDFFRDLDKLMTVD